MTNQINSLKMGQKLKKTPAGEIPVEWEAKEIGALLDYERPDKYIVKNTDYSSDPASGIPVLTANKSFILGYTDEDFGVCTDTPVIIFDDFTTDSKYVDFHFKVKSSAIKILRAKAGFDLKYIFEAMRLINFAVGDHKRYYISEYQKIVLPVPPLAEQRKIAEVLSAMDDEINKTSILINGMRSVKNGLMRALLTGKVRV